MIYLDYNASTPVDSVVREAMLPHLGERHGNPTSGHAAGRAARQAVEHAREQVAALLGAQPESILFTSGGTESNNHVIKGVAETFKGRGRHIITSAVEHPAVMNPCRFLERQGFEVTYVPVDRHGRVDPKAVVHEVRPDTILISIMYANNEVGTLEPIAEIAEAAHQGGVMIHTDAAQACGKVPVRVEELGVDFLSIAGHKMYAPQGIGALYIRRGVRIEPLQHGASHQGGRRAGTEPVALIVALGAAAELARTSLDETAAHLRKMRDRLHEALKQSFGDKVVLLGHPEKRLPNTLAIGFRGCVGGEVLAACPDLCASTGSACHTGERKRSGVLAAMDVAEEIAFGAVRFSVGRGTTEAEVDAAVAQLVRAAAS